MRFSLDSMASKIFSRGFDDTWKTIFVLDQPYLERFTLSTERIPLMFRDKTPNPYVGFKKSFNSLMGLEGKSYELLLENCKVIVCDRGCTFYQREMAKNIDSIENKEGVKK